MSVRKIRRNSKIKIGVFGARRGATMVTVMAQHPEAELAAIYDYSATALKNCAKLAK